MGGKRRTVKKLLERKIVCGPILTTEFKAKNCILSGLEMVAKEQSSRTLTIYDSRLG